MTTYFAIRPLDFRLGKTFSHLSLFKHLVASHVNFKMLLRLLFTRLTFSSNLTFTKIKLSVKLPLCTYEGTELYFYSFFTLTLGGDEWSASRFGRSTLVKEPRFPLNRKWGGGRSRSGRSEEDRSVLTLPGIERSFFRCTARGRFAVLITPSRLPKT